MLEIFYVFDILRQLLIVDCTKQQCGFVDKMLVCFDQIIIILKMGQHLKVQSNITRSDLKQKIEGESFFSRKNLLRYHQMFLSVGQGHYGHINQVRYVKMFDKFGNQFGPFFRCCLQTFHHRPLAKGSLYLVHQRLHAQLFQCFYKAQSFPIFI